MPNFCPQNTRKLKKKWAWPRELLSAWPPRASARFRSPGVPSQTKAIDAPTGSPQLPTAPPLPRPPSGARPMEGQSATQPHVGTSSTGATAAGKRLNSRVRARACKQSQSDALGGDSAAAAGHTRHAKSRTHGASSSGDRLPAAGDGADDATVRRESKRGEEAPTGAASARPGATSSRELRRGTAVPAASRPAAAPPAAPAPRTSTRSAEASAVPP